MARLSFYLFNILVFFFRGCVFLGTSMHCN
jgi:hypothetical protein